MLKAINTMLMSNYQGRCHCGAVTFEVETDLAAVLECNCSHCGVKSLILSFVPATQFRLLSGESELTEYRFNKHAIAHLFCRICGVQSFGRGEDPATGVETIAINVRTFANVDISKLTLTPFDGKSL
ncbi:MAG: GFA family protein [Candidatus Moraniibacteriota bacterium]